MFYQTPEQILRCAQEGCLFYQTPEQILRCAQEGCLFYQTPEQILRCAQEARRTFYQSGRTGEHMENENTTAAEKVMAEVAFNLQALVEHALEKVAKPPRGTMKEVGHYRTLNKLKRKEFDALAQLLDEVTYNVAATLFATLDGSIQSQIPDFPKLALVEQETNSPLAENLHQAFADVWE